MNFNDKISSFIESNSLNNQELARMCDMSQSEFSRYKTMKQKPSIDKIKLFYKGGISADWLINDDNVIYDDYDMFADNEAGRLLAERYSERNGIKLPDKINKEEALNIEKNVTENHYNDDNYIPVYDVDAQAGTLLFPDAPDESLIDYIKIPGVKADGAIVVHGDSMHPEYQSGDLILVKKITENFIQYGRAFLICTNEQRAIKYLFPTNGDDKTMVLRSCNERYPDFSINKEEILHLYLIIGKFRKEVV